jgi:hypothetical protein
MVRAVAGGKRGVLNVGYSPSRRSSCFRRRCDCFTIRIPNIRVQLHDLAGGRRSTACAARELDVALTVQGITEDDGRRDVRGTARYALCVAVPASHALAGARKISLKQLVDQPLIAYTRADYYDYHVMLEQLFAPFKRQPKSWKNMMARPAWWRRSPQDEAWRWGQKLWQLRRTRSEDHPADSRAEADLRRRWCRLSEEDGFGGCQEFHRGRQNRQLDGCLRQLAAHDDRRPDSDVVVELPCTPVWHADAAV